MVGGCVSSEEWIANEGRLCGVFAATCALNLWFARENARRTAGVIGARTCFVYFFNFLHLRSPVSRRFFEGLSSRGKDCGRSTRQGGTSRAPSRRRNPRQARPTFFQLSDLLPAATLLQPPASGVCGERMRGSWNVRATGKMHLP